MKTLFLIAVLMICLPIAWIVAAVVVPVVLGLFGIALIPVILLGKLLFPILIIWIIWKLLVDDRRRA